MNRRLRRGIFVPPRDTYRLSTIRFFDAGGDVFYTTTISMGLLLLLGQALIHIYLKRHGWAGAP